MSSRATAATRVSMPLHPSGRVNAARVSKPAQSWTTPDPSSICAGTLPRRAARMREVTAPRRQEPGNDLVNRTVSEIVHMKRVFDVIAALLVLPIAAPAVLICALVVRMTSPGPAIFRQIRVGLHEQPFTCYKLRTMFIETRDVPTHQSSASSVTPVGKWLRALKLDELPQLWNIIRGDMSLVGPRPFPAYHMSAFDPEFQALRVTVPPGLTGLWQISSRSDGDLEDQRAQDCFYIRNRALWLDLYILVATLPAVIRGQGAK